MIATAAAAAAVVCSCGVSGCRELGWPHEWDPVAIGDTCALAVDEELAFARVGGHWRTVQVAPPHPVRSPYVRWGSGYACASCAAEAETAAA